MLGRQPFQILKSLGIAAFLFVNFLTEVSGQNMTYRPANQVAGDFKKLLERPRTNPRPDIQVFKTDSVTIERGYFFSEKTEKVPLLLYKPTETTARKLPVIICLHGTGGSKDNQDIKNILFHFSKLGFMAVAIDARFHGERAQSSVKNMNSYETAILEAWKNKDLKSQQHPFFYDTVFDLWRLTDYLISRPDVDPLRIGMTGISMGGIETWMAASVDQRIKVAVPIIAAQSFKWSLENNQWQGRAGTIRKVHEEVARDLGSSEVSAENVRTLWDKILPGILDEFDCPSMIRLFAPRPLLLLNNEKDQNCPLPGAELVFLAAEKAYSEAKSEDKFQVHISPNEPHRFLDEHLKLASDWFTKWL